MIVAVTDKWIMVGCSQTRATPGKTSVTRRGGSGSGLTGVALINLWVAQVPESSGHNQDYTPVALLRCKFPSQPRPRRHSRLLPYHFVISAVIAACALPNTSLRTLDLYPSWESVRILPGPPRSQSSSDADITWHIGRYGVVLDAGSSVSFSDTSSAFTGRVWLTSSRGRASIYTGG
jgi:hypothetical protein